MVEVIPDSSKTHWVNRAPEGVRPFLQLSRLDRPVGYWLLALPGWIGLAFAGLSHGLVWTDLKWAALILIGAIAMRGAGCTYNDIVDQDLDAQVERTALRPLPAGTITNKQAWVWLFVQCAVGLIVLLMLPRLAQIVSLLSIPLVAAYPFMKRITWFPQVWLGLTFNWAVLVAYVVKTETIDVQIITLYLGLVFWTIGYDTIYACQDLEDDAFVGIKSTARRFGRWIKVGVGFCYFISVGMLNAAALGFMPFHIGGWRASVWLLPLLLFGTHLSVQIIKFDPNDSMRSLSLFKSNVLAGFLAVFSFIAISLLGTQFIT